KQEIKILPFDTAQELVDELILVCIAPDDRIVRVLQEERHRGDLEVIRLKRDDPARTADLEFLPFGPHHLWNVRAMDIHIANADMPPFERKTHGKIRRASTLSYPTLVTHNEDFVFDPL